MDKWSIFEDLLINYIESLPYSDEDFYLHPEHEKEYWIKHDVIGDVMRLMNKAEDAEKDFEDTVSGSGG